MAAVDYERQIGAKRDHCTATRLMFRPLQQHAVRQGPAVVKEYLEEDDQSAVVLSDSRTVDCATMRIEARGPITISGPSGRRFESSRPDRSDQRNGLPTQAIFAVQPRLSSEITEDRFRADDVSRQTDRMHLSAIHGGPSCVAFANGLIDRNRLFWLTRSGHAGRQLSGRTARRVD